MNQSFGTGSGSTEDVEMDIYKTSRLLQGEHSGHCHIIGRTGPEGSIWMDNTSGVTITKPNNDTSHS